MIAYPPIGTRKRNSRAFCYFRRCREYIAVCERVLKCTYVHFTTATDEIGCDYGYTLIANGYT